VTPLFDNIRIHMNRILVLDPESPTSRHIASLLAEAEGYESVSIQTLSSLPEFAVTASALVCRYERHSEALTSRALPVLIVDAEPGIRRAITAIKAGAGDYLPAGCSKAELLESLARVIAEHSDAVEAVFPTVGASQVMQTLTDNIAKVGPTESTVLISGESGTGKELVARAIHARSNRRTAPLISLNCATVPADLIEAELFGHPGEDTSGLIATATGGTLFLDEVGELPAGAQVRLLRALESGLDVRLIAATTRDLDTLVSNGQFRSDLYYRLKVIALKVPPLRERGDDVLLLAEEILARTMDQLGKRGLFFAAETQADMRRYEWPGNVRELENAIQRAVILSDGGVISTAMLAIELSRDEAGGAAPAADPDQTIEDYFVNFVTTHQDNMTETELAEKLGISRKSLWERRQRLNIPRKKTKKRGRRRDVS
jgi:DNA-binding NtrC family response regulator